MVELDLLFLKIILEQTGAGLFLLVERLLQNDVPGFYGLFYVRKLTVRFLLVWMAFGRSGDGNRH